MKAYKATNNMKCLSFTYEVGKTYTFVGKLIMCEQGFHFCKNPKDVLKWYTYNKDFILLEIDVTGKIIDATDSKKSLTDQFTVTRIIPKEEIFDLLNIEIKYDEKGNVIYQKNNDGIEYTWEYKYDEKGNVIYKKNNDGIYTWEYKYDEKGNVIYKKDYNGTEFKYDEKGNVIYKKCSNGTEWEIKIN